MRFYDGENEFTASIEDIDFLEGIEKRTIFIAPGYELIVEQKTTQSRPNKKLLTTRTILAVRKIIPFIPEE